MERVHTGSPMLDAALAGGLRTGAALLVTGEEGAGATEFALTLLRASAHEKRHARFASALRSPPRVKSEMEALFEDDSAARQLDVRALDVKSLRQGADHVLVGLEEGDVLVLESADSLTTLSDPGELRAAWQGIADAAAARGVLVLLLHSPGTLPAWLESTLAEEADGVLRFSWHDAGPTRRRVLALVKMRGLAPALDGDHVPVFEVSLQRGVGFSVARGKSVL